MGLLEGHAPKCNYEISVHHYNKDYYLADAIYPRWLTFMKTIKSESGDPITSDDHSYNYQGPLASVDHELPNFFADFLDMH
jgi:hypothetical protein